MQTCTTAFGNDNSDGRRPGGGNCARPMDGGAGRAAGEGKGDGEDPFTQLLNTMDSTGSADSLMLCNKALSTSSSQGCRCVHCMGHIKCAGAVVLSVCQKEKTTHNTHTGVRNAALPPRVSQPLSCCPQQLPRSEPQTIRVATPCVHVRSCLDGCSSCRPFGCGYVNGGGGYPMVSVVSGKGEVSPTLCRLTFLEDQEFKVCA